MAAFAKKLPFLLQLLVIIFIAHHIMVYFHEWVHGTAAWITGYKTHPFDIHYGERWFSLWDINEAVPYQQILADGKPSIMAFIAISPVICQMLMFIMGLKLLGMGSIQSKQWLFAFVFWATFFELAEVYAYIPIRTFAPQDDIYNFLYAASLSPWVVAIPGTLFVIWGIYRILTVEEPRACVCLQIESKAGRVAFLLATVILFFGYHGGIGFMMTDSISQNLSKASWALIPVCLLAIYAKNRLNSNIKKI